MGNKYLEELEPGLVTQEAEPELKVPRMFKVMMLNDDYTPMEFVVLVLQQFFAMNSDQANQVMWEVHTKGQAACGIYSYDIAETKLMQVHEYARDHEYPLLCKMEPV
ncbi:MAG: ATP-dependent Clp protease adapter ClpS [Gammaproteobacteria bacterium]